MVLWCPVMKLKDTAIDIIVSKFRLFFRSSVTRGATPPLRNTRPPLFGRYHKFRFRSKITHQIENCALEWMLHFRMKIALQIAFRIRSYKKVSSYRTKNSLHTAQKNRFISNHKVATYRKKKLPHIERKKLSWYRRKNLHHIARKIPLIINLNELVNRFAKLHNNKRLQPFLNSIVIIIEHGILHITVSEDWYFWNQISRMW